MGVPENDLTGWFEHLYVAEREGTGSVPWDRGKPNPLLSSWTAEQGLNGTARAALVVGSGLGFDAEHIAALGFATTAFDLSQTAVATARERFPGSPVDYTVADLLEPPPEWNGAFDFVFESLTVQSLAPGHHLTAIRNVAAFVALGGTLLVVAGVHPGGEVDGPPWPLTREEITAFAGSGLTLQHLETVPAADEPWRTTWRAELRRLPG